MSYDTFFFIGYISFNDLLCEVRAKKCQMKLALMISILLFINNREMLLNYILLLNVQKDKRLDY